MMKDSEKISCGVDQQPLFGLSELTIKSVHRQTFYVKDRRDSSVKMFCGQGIGNEKPSFRFVFAYSSWLGCQDTKAYSTSNDPDGSQYWTKGGLSV